MIYLRGINACGCLPEQWKPTPERICCACGLYYSKMDERKLLSELNRPNDTPRNLKGVEETPQEGD